MKSDDTAAIKKLFDDAEACGDRYHCPPLDELTERAARPHELRLLDLAFDLMVDPKVGVGGRKYKAASTTGRAWCAARSTEGHTLSAEEERALRRNVLRLLARKDAVVSAHSFVEYLADARQIFEAEAINPKRSDVEVASALRGLRTREPDLKTITKWLAGKDTAVAGALLLDGVDHDHLPVADEVTMLLEFARRTDSPPDAARLIAQHAIDHEDAAFAPVVKALAGHPDASVREAAAAKPSSP